MTDPVVVAVSDVCVGYHSPSIPVRLRQVAEALGATPYLIEPVIPDTPTVAVDDEEIQGINILRVNLPEAFYTERGRQRFITGAAKVIGELKPICVMPCSAYVLGVLEHIPERSPITLYLSLETISVYPPHMLEEHKRAAGLIDLVVFPDPDRARIDCELLGWQNKRHLVMLNAILPASSAEAILPADQRNGRILYAGTIGPMTCADTLTLPELAGVPLDWCGLVRDGRWPARIHGEQRYLGRLSRRELAALRPQYSWSIVAWVPRNVNQYYASPNKLYESIGQGVPVICAPHPQCISTLHDRAVGVLTKGWGKEAWLNTLPWAAGVAKKKDTLTTFINGCRQVAETDLNREATFAPVREWLEGRCSH